MNFLAHLHLATLSDSSLIGNLAADFIRGNPYTTYSKNIADGVMLHRRIDKMTDSHPIIKTCRHYFDQEHVRISSITLDIVWDHFLSLHWREFTPTISLIDFITWSKNQIEPELHIMSEEFQHFITVLWQQNWLVRYADLHFIANVLQGMATQRPKLVKLATSINDVEKHYNELKQVFYAFYPSMMVQATQHIL